jgi:glycosyltransferase involved in cell wall biosynthesis
MHGLEQANTNVSFTTLPHGGARAHQGGRILLVTPQPFYEDRGTPIAVGETCRALGELGYEVDLLAFPVGEDRPIARVTTHRCANPLRIRSVPIGFSLDKCVLDAALLRAFERLLCARSYRLVHAVEEAAYMASFLCPRFDTPYIYDMASSIPAELRAHWLLGAPGMRSVLAAMERRVLAGASHVVCSAGLGDRIRAVAPAVAYTEWRFPGVAGAVDARTVRELRVSLGIEREARVVLYSGNFARYQGVDLLFDAFASALREDPSLMLVCVGASAASRDALLARLAEPVRPRVRILTRQPRHTMPAYFALADCLISLRPDNHNLPLKVFDYMAAGKPIVATRGPAHEPVLNGERAFMCDAHVESIAAAMLAVFRSATHGQRIAESARRYSQRQFGWRSFVQLVESVYGRVLHDGREVRALS